MANIKFSQFTVGNTESDIDFVVGYKGANNIQISPANLLSATLAGYLPLTGGTMTGTGDLHFPDNFALKIGSASNGDAQLYHNGNRTELINFTGDLRIINGQDDGDITFRCDNGSGGTAEYFRIDGTTVQNTFSKTTNVIDNFYLGAGNSTDLYLTHDGTNSSIINNTGNLTIQNNHNDGDILFRSDDGSGGTATYFSIDGGIGRNIFSKDSEHSDNVSAYFGSSNDFRILHNGSHTFLSQNGTGDLRIVQNIDDGDILFQSDDGGGGVATYFSVDGGAQLNRFAKNVMWNDNVSAYFGGGFDLKIIHNGTFSSIQNNTGDFKIINYADDTDIIFENDNGSGGTTEYFRVDGGLEQVIFSKEIKLLDTVKIKVGGGGDLQLVHNGTDSFIQNSTGDLVFKQNTDDGDMSFQCDDGSGGLAEYFRLDGSLATGSRVYTVFPDNSTAVFGTASDLQIYHDASDSYIDNITNHLVIQNQSANKDIIFKCDDGSGGVTTYFQLDGSNVNVSISKQFNWLDSVVASFGNSADLQIFHNSTDSFIDNYTGDLTIRNRQDDGNIQFVSDDGSGGLAEYFRVDGGAGETIFSRNTLHLDNIKAIFGNGDDLEIYHDGSNSYIDDSGTGHLVLNTNGASIKLLFNDSEFMGHFLANGAVRLYYNNSQKLETTSTGIKITGVSEYADNTAAIAGGLTTGDVYRTGDLLKIVH